MDTLTAGEAVILLGRLGSWIRSAVFRPRDAVATRSSVRDVVPPKRVPRGSGVGALFPKIGPVPSFVRPCRAAVPDFGGHGQARLPAAIIITAGYMPCLYRGGAGQSFTWLETVLVIFGGNSRRCCWKPCSLDKEEAVILIVGGCACCYRCN